MPLRTPRRRISPRTVRRYRAIRNFFRKTLGSVASQPDININSSIAVNVTHLKHKIVGIEHQLDEVSKHCRELASIDNISRVNTENSIQTEDNTASTAQIEGAPSTRNSVDNEARVLYKTLGSQFEKLDDNDNLPKLHNECSERDRRSGDSMNNFEVYTSQISKVKTKKNKRDIHYDNDYGEGSPNLRKNIIQQELKDCQAFYSSSCHVEDTPRTEHHLSPSDYPIHGRKKSWLEDQLPARSPTQDRDEEPGARHKERSPRNKSKSPPRARESKHGKSKRHKSVCLELDQDYIADIIKRQYKPMTMFGRRESDFSQMSTPVCRDQETYGVPENEVDGCEPCSCCERGAARGRRGCRHRPGDLHSLCDARAYSSRRRARSKHRRHYVDPYNDSSLYDIVPVKERSSPKSRRKFFEDMTHYEHYREVPPSPKSQRPRLNLRAQKYDYEDFTEHNTRRKRSPYKQRRRCDEDFSDDSSDETVLNESNAIYPKLPTHTKNAQVQEDMEKMSNLRFGTHANKINANLNDALKKTQEIDLNNDKTDKALCEIKDILQSFLQEIKRDTAGSQCDKVSDVGDKINEKPQEECQQDAAKVTTSVIPGSAHNGFGGGAAQCGLPYLPGFANPCCYPLMPVCPVNCVQSGFVMPSTSFTCQNCVSQKEPNCACAKDNNTFEDDTSKKQSETENLIREIYKYVAQIPSSGKKESSGTSKAYSPRENGQADFKILTSRSAGKSSNASKLDANVGTLPLKCYSKSCEALGPRLSDNYYSRTNASFSDTILEKMSIEITSRSKTPSEASEPQEEEKKKASRFANVMRSFGLLKKRKKNKDFITELSESDKTIEVDVLPRHGGPPFRQDISNYMMYGQEYYQPPPVPPLGPHRHPRAHSPHYDYRYPPYDPRMAAFPNAGMNDMYDPYRERHHESPPYYPGMHPQASAPPYSSSYEPQCTHNLQPQVPLCLKEIEVRSTGTQSERKMPFYKKFSQKKKQSATVLIQEEQKNVAAQSTQNKPKMMFNWKQLQAKTSKTAHLGLEPIEYSLKTQKRLAEGDIKLRDALLSKLLKKKNPFSQKNMLMRSLMAGKESAGWTVPSATKKNGSIRPPKLFM